MDNISDLQSQYDKASRSLDVLNKEIATLQRKRQSLLKEQKELEIRLNAARLNALSGQSDSESPYDKQFGFPWSTEIHRIRETVFHLTEFRPLQLRAINATLDGKDLILVMPTGAGKSLVYQLPAMLDYDRFRSADSKLSSFNPLTLVISPLVSLMTDQIMNLTRIGLPVGSVTVFDASTSLPDQKRILDQLAATQHKPSTSNVPLRLLFVTPEKLAKSKRLLNRLETAYKNGRLARIAIDEVHCVSQWGHDFRPDYQFLHVLRRQFPSVPILGLTATASAEVIVDIQSMLDLKSDRCLVIRSGYNRPNLYYEVQLATGSVKGSVQEIRDLISSRFPNESGIVYCFSQKDTEDVARGLRELGLKAACYHANMEAVLRSQVHKQWFLEKINIIVATVAFGMGIDKPNVRFVLHYSTSKSLENYYQESGRAGRDAATAACVLIWRFSDLFRLASMVSAERTGLAKLYQMIEYCLDPVTCRRRLIARHLSDGSWSPTDCLKACDNCRRRDHSGLTERVSNLNVTNLIQATSELLINHQNRKQERVTGPKLVDLMVVNTEIRSVVNGVRWSARSRDDRRFFEYFVAWSLVNHWLKMEFHFTPYSTVCYVVPSRVPDQDVVMMPYAEDLEKTLKHHCEDQQNAGKIVTEPIKKKHRPNPVQTVHIDSDSE